MGDHQISNRCWSSRSAVSHTTPPMCGPRTRGTRDENTSLKIGTTWQASEVGLENGGACAREADYSLSLVGVLREFASSPTSAIVNDCSRLAVVDIERTHLGARTSKSSRSHKRERCKPYAKQV